MSIVAAAMADEALNNKINAAVLYHHDALYLEASSPYSWPMENTAPPPSPSVPYTAQPVRPLAETKAARSSNRAFLGKAWRILVAIKDALALLFLLLFFWLLFGFLRGTPNPAVVGDGALLLKLKGTIVEQPAEMDLMSALQGGSDMPKEFRARDVVRALETAATDDRVKAVVLDLDSFMGGGQVTLGDVGAAMDKVRAAKKPILTYATAYTDDSYQLAAHASEIWMNNFGQAVITGPGGSNLYFKGLIDQIGAKAHIYRVGTFKSAVEPFMRSDMSPEAEQATRAYADVLWSEWLRQVKAARPAAQIDAYIADPTAVARANGNDMAKAAMTMKIIDKQGDRFAFSKRIAQITGTLNDDKPWAFKAIPYKAWVDANPIEDSGTPIAVVPIVGNIVDGKQPSGTAGGDTVAKHILEAVADDSVKALVLRVDSPGGSVLASEQIRQAILQAKAKKLPVVVSMANLAASGGYWVSMPGDKVFAEPDTITGSIGVFGVLPSFEGTLAKWGVNADGIKTTPLSGEPDIFKGVSPEFNALAQASVEDIYSRFTGLVAQSRKLPIEKVREIAEGRVWAGGTAHQLGLVDGFGGLDVAVAEAAKLAKLEAKSVYPKYFENEPDPWTEMLQNFGGIPDDGDEWNEQTPQGLFAKVSILQQARMADALDQLKLLVVGGNVQARCLECSDMVAPKAVSPKAADGMLAKLAALFAE